MDRETDIVVIGAGAAGLSAALTAVEAGLDVLVLEKEGEVGGSSLMSGGSLAFAGTDIQAANGIADSEQTLFDDLLRVGGGESDPDVVRAYAGNQQEVYEWLKRHGVPFAPTLRASPGNSVLRTHTAVPATFIPILHEKLRASGRAEIVCGARAGMLLTDAESGRVVGVETSGSDAFVARARCGVVLTSGGFTRAPDLVRRFAPAFAKARFSGGAGNTGDGLVMAWKLGADIRDVAFIQGNFGTHPDAKGNAVVHAIHKGAITINRRGLRYVDESISYKAHSEHCMQQPGQVTYQIFDQDIFDRGDDAVPAYSFRSRLSIGELIPADSLADLAAAIGVPSAALEETVRRYNSGVESGSDDFDRRALAGDKGELVKIEHGPFYAYPSTVVVLGTYCGIRVDAQMHVIDVFGMEIEGLFAAGEVVGGFHGRGEIPGAALGKALVFGRVAARAAAAGHGAGEATRGSVAAE